MWLFWISDLMDAHGERAYDRMFERMHDIQLDFILAACESRPRYMAYIELQTGVALEL